MKRKNGERSSTLRFIDSFRFMSSNLENVAKNLRHSEFIETKKCFPALDQFESIKR